MWTKIYAKEQFLHILNLMERLLVFNTSYRVSSGSSSVFYFRTVNTIKECDKSTEI